MSRRSISSTRVLHPADEAGCAILYIDTTERTHVEEILQAVADQPTLTVGDLPEFLLRGGMIQFQFVENRVRFSVNLDAVSRRHLTISSELLKVAMSVRGRMPEGGAQ